MPREASAVIECLHSALPPPPHVCPRAHIDANWRETLARNIADVSTPIPLHRHDLCVYRPCCSCWCTATAPYAPAPNPLSSHFHELVTMMQVPAEEIRKLLSFRLINSQKTLDQVITLPLLPPRCSPHQLAGHGKDGRER
jgi:hypothetical protein